jgi:hypothetical protein
MGFTKKISSDKALSKPIAQLPLRKKKKTQRGKIEQIWMRVTRKHQDLQKILKIINWKWSGAKKVERRRFVRKIYQKKMVFSATVVGALLGLGTQMYSNALRKLPYMRRNYFLPTNH